LEKEVANTSSCTSSMETLLPHTEALLRRIYGKLSRSFCVTNEKHYPLVVAFLRAWDVHNVEDLLGLDNDNLVLLFLNLHGCEIKSVPKIMIGSFIGR